MFLAFYVHAEDGYFMSMKQKKELILHGKVTEDHHLYNILVCPGYVPPVKNAATNNKKAIKALGEYFKKKKYQDCKNAFKRSNKFAFKDVLWKFTIKDGAKKWKTNFEKAHIASDKKVAGHMFAYPWAILKSTFDNAFRIPWGLAEFGVVSFANSFIPVYYGTNSTIKAAYYFGIQGTTYPVMQLGWNTLTATPISLISQKPSEDRYDGFWVQCLGNVDVDYINDPEDVKKVMLSVIDSLIIENSEYFADRIKCREDFRVKYNSLKAKMDSLKKENEFNLREIDKKIEISVNSSLDSLRNNPDSDYGNCIFQEKQRLRTSNFKWELKGNDRSNFIVLYNIIVKDFDKKNENVNEEENTEPVKEAVKAFEEVDKTDPLKF